ncbi:unnamed protein product [Durusdinium trenchii]|uniref:Uncharacterized protein n=2 Tax=Durusdinium trenchii TaxID=1381693 RepID=A0ABP0MQ39_9DINO
MVLNTAALKLAESFLGIKDFLGPTSEIPEDTRETPAPPAPEIHLPSDGPIGQNYEVIMDVPPQRLDAFHGPAMQPYQVGMLSHMPVLSSMPSIPLSLGCLVSRRLPLRLKTTAVGRDCAPPKRLHAAKDFL